MSIWPTKWSRRVSPAEFIYQVNFCGNFWHNVPNLGFTAAYLQDHRVELEDGSIRADIEEQKARPQGDYDKLLDDLQDRYTELSNSSQLPKYKNQTFLGKPGIARGLKKICSVVDQGGEIELTQNGFHDTGKKCVDAEQVALVIFNSSP